MAALLLFLIGDIRAGETGWVVFDTAVLGFWLGSEYEHWAHGL